MTVPSECELWAEVLEGDLVGAPLPVERRERAAAHEVSCARCTAERDTWRALKQLPAESRDDAFVERVLGKLDGERGRGAWGFGALALVLSAAAVLVLWTRAHHEDARPTRSVSSARIVVVSGDVLVDGAVATKGAQLRASAVVTTDAGRACVSLDPGVRACIDRNSELRIADLTTAKRTLELRRGRVVAALDPQPKGTSFEISTDAGSVIAVGTELTVDRRGGSVVARVLHGVVRVVTARGDQRLGAHERVDLGTGDRSQASSTEEQEDRAVLDGDAPPTPSASSADEIAPAPTQSAETLAPTPSPADLLRTARTLRGEHKIGEAAQAYRRLEALHPESAEAHASYLSLGELQLGGLNDPGGALHSFDAYLRSPGSSTRDARYGRIRALAALHRTDDERVAIEAFITDYPTSEEASELREWLK